MASPTRSAKKKTTHVRRASKSPKRKYSIIRVQTVVQLESEDPVYSDPVDSSRALIPNVVFQRRDRENLSPQAIELFDSHTIFEDEAERSWLHENMRGTTVSVKIDDNLFTINGNYSMKENQPWVICLHGFDEGSNWANWIKLAYPLVQRGRYSVLFIDFPGFGQSSGRSLDQTSWKRYGPEIIAGILSSFSIQRAVSVVAECGGAATIVRTINRYPQWFRNRGHVFINSVIGDFGEPNPGDLEMNLARSNIRIAVFWIPDRDHTKRCVAYKRWNKLRLKKFQYLELIDLDPVKQTYLLSYPTVRVLKISRCASRNKAYVHKLSNDFIQKIVDILDRK